MRLYCNIAAPTLRTLRGLCLRFAPTLALASALSPHVSASMDGLELDFQGSHRLRYEYLQEGPRPEARQHDKLLASRLYLDATARYGNFFAELEIQDSRVWLDSDSTPLGTDDVNTVEPIQALIGWQGTDDLPLRVSVGRMTKNLSTRRLLARNRFRNTTNSFLGIDGLWAGTDWSISGFIFEPLTRLPEDRAALADNRFAWDRSSAAQRLWGIELQPASSEQWSVHVLGLHEEDRANAPTTNRQLITVGGQYHASDTRHGWFHAAELALQAGTSRATDSPDDRHDRRHSAWFMHAELGRQSHDPRIGRVSVLFDYASGDRDPNDGSTQRFDTLFGARRFDFGPTGIYGPQGRSNMLSPGVRWNAHPLAPTRLDITWRAFWLAQASDSHDGSGGVGGAAGERYVGQQIEARIRQRVTDAVRLEAGAAWLRKGALLSSAAFNRSDRDATYLYVQTTVHF